MPESSGNDRSESYLTQWGRDKNDSTFFRTTFSNVYVNISIKISLKFVPKGPFNNRIGSNNGLALATRQAIIWI